MNTLPSIGETTLGSRNWIMKGCPSGAGGAIRLVISFETAPSTAKQNQGSPARQFRPRNHKHKESIPPLKMQRFMQTVNQLRRPLQRRPRRSAARHLIVLPLLHSPGQWLLRCLRGAKLSCRFTIQRSCGQGHLADLGTKGWFTFPVLPPAVYEHYRLGQFMDITD